MSQPPTPRPPVPAPDAVLSFTVQGNFLTTNMVPPRLTIDGWPAPLPVTGTRKIPIWSGRHHLQVHSQWLRQYGHAALDIDVAPGQTLDVFYAPPHQNFYDQGAIGHGPQVRRGRGVMIATWTMISLLLLAVVGLFLGMTLATFAMLATP
ncbi:hypothetical protein ACFWEJ_05815 [Promicromonospora sp. NPDC060204]|uniref:hypothetical protein n=1 Tax=Promicromonospora sp. NPDC060204 TaxID=3347071 RepID=UPI0036460079